MKTARLWLVFASVALALPSGAPAQVNYWLGSSFEGFRANSADEYRDGTFEVAYTRPGTDRIIWVVNESLRPALRTLGRDRDPCLRTTVRGVPTMLIRAYPSTNTLFAVHVFTGRRLVTIFEMSRAQGLRAGWALRRWRRLEAPAPRLAPPVVNVSRVLRRCQTLTPALTG